MQCTARCQLTWWRALLVSLCAAVAVTPTSGSAGEAEAELGAARVRYDDERWQANERPGRIDITPLDTAKPRMDPVKLRVLDDAASCSDLARQAFETGHYETRSLEPKPVSIGGKTGERFVAHTGCRNATPRGVVICVKVAGHAYLLQALNASCEGRNLFSGIDPLEEIAGGISFSDTPH